MRATPYLLSLPALVLFAAIVIQIPILLADFTASILSGFPPSPAFAAAAEHSLLQMLVINIPFVAFAALTRNLLEAVTGAVAIGFIVAVSGLMTATSASELAPISRSGFNWVPYTAGAAVMLFGAAWVLWLQYFSRRTAVSWVSAGAITVLFSLIVTFANFDIVQIMTAGGPRNMTHVFATYAFLLGIRSGDLPLGAATSLFMFPILAVAAIFILRGVRKRGREIG